MYNVRPLFCLSGWAWELVLGRECGVLAPLPLCVRTLLSASTLEGRDVMDTLCVWLGLIHGLTLLSRHHSSSLSIADGFN